MSSSGAHAAAPGQYTVGTTPIALTQPADPFLGNFTPSADAATQGMFAPQVSWPVIPVNATLLPNGHIVSYGTPVGQAVQGGLAYDDWSPAGGTNKATHSVTKGMETYNSFCNSLATLPDGRLIMVGGNTTMGTMTYDPTTKAQAMGSNLNRQRWYATTLRLPDNRILVLGGGNYYNTGAYLNPNDNSGVATTPEIGSGTGPWTLLTGATSTGAFGAERNKWWYPRAYVMPNGKVFGMSDNKTWVLSPSGKGKLVVQDDDLPFSPGVSGSSVMYTTAKVLVAGGGQNMNTDGVTATNAAAVVDFPNSISNVRTVAPMAQKRNWLNLTVLANGEVLANGGTTVSTDGGAANSNYQSEIWNPTTETWRTGATAARTRTYHSTALLMQTGAVFTGGGGVPGPEDNLNSEMYYPSYLFTKAANGTVSWANRQQITSIAGSATYGGKLTLGLSDTRKVASASLIRLGSVTHSVNTDQRRIPVNLGKQTGNSLAVTIPNNKNNLPAGSYMLQTVDTKGVPSPGQTLTLDANGAAGTVTVYEPQTGLGSGADGGIDYTGGTVPLTVGTVVGLEPGNFPGYRVRHANYGARLDQLGTDSPVLDRADSSFAVRTGLAGDGVSFEAVNFPGYYLKANGSGNNISLAPKDDTPAFATAATFVAVQGLSGQGTSFHLYDDANVYLRHANFVLGAATNDGSDLFRADSSFRVKTGLLPLVPGARIGLEPSQVTGSLVRHANYVAQVSVIGATSSPADKADSTFIVRQGLNGTGCMSLESVNYPGYFLRQSGGAVRLDANDGSPGFANDATFCPVSGLSGDGGVTLRTAADQLPTVHADATTVSISDLGNTEDERRAVSFNITQGLG